MLQFSKNNSVVKILCYYRPAVVNLTLLKGLYQYIHVYPCVTFVSTITLK